MYITSGLIKLLFKQLIEENILLYPDEFIVT